MQEKPVEIVKRIPNPNEEPTKMYEDEAIFEEHLHYEKSHQNSGNKLVLMLFGLAVTLLIGFYGFKFLTKNDEITTISTQKVAVATQKPNNENSTIQTLAKVTPTPKPPVEETQKVEKVQEVVKAEEATPTPVAKVVTPEPELEVAHEPTHYTETLALPTAPQENTPKSTPEEITTVSIKEEILETMKETVEEQKDTPDSTTPPKEEPIAQKVAQEVTPKSEPILVSHNALNIIEIVHEKPMSVEEYDAQEKAKKAEPIVVEEPEAEPTPPVQQSRSAHYEMIKPRYYKVRTGDTLATIAKRFYGNTSKYRGIVRANQRLRSSKTALRLGEKLLIPRTDGKTTRRYILVEKGDSLALLAKEFYGDKNEFKRIIRANYRIKNANSTLRIGQKIYLPE